MTDEFWQEMMDARGKLAFTLLWLVVAVVICGAFVLNEWVPVGTLVMLVSMFIGAFIVALMQMVLNPNGPSRMLYFLLAGAWMLTAVGFGREWLYLDPGQMKGWLLACIALVSLAIVGTWWDDVRWRCGGVLMMGCAAVWALCGISGWVSAWLDRGETWADRRVWFEHPFFLEHEEGEHLITRAHRDNDGATLHGAYPWLESYTTDGLVAEYPISEDMTLISLSQQWNGKFAILGTENAFAVRATGPMKSWIRVMDAKLKQDQTPDLEPMRALYGAAIPYFRHGTDESPWRLIPLWLDAPVNAIPRDHRLRAWNPDTGEVKDFPDIRGGLVGGWLDESRIAFIRMVEENDTNGERSATTLHLETLDIESGERQTRSSMRVEGFNRPLHQHMDTMTFAAVSQQMYVIDWRTGERRSYGVGPDQFSMGRWDTPDGMAFSFATWSVVDELRDLYLIMDRGEEHVLKGLEGSILDSWPSPDGKRVLFMQETAPELPIPFDIPFTSARLRVWNVETGKVSTVHHYGLTDSLIQSFSAGSLHTACSPWSADGRRVVLRHLRPRWFPWPHDASVLRVVEVE